MNPQIISKYLLHELQLLQEEISSGRYSAVKEAEYGWNIVENNRDYYEWLIS